MSAPEAIAALEDVGWEPLHARLYVHLLGQGSATVRDVLPHFELSRPSLYRILESMMASGLVTASTSRPTRYTAVAPARVIAEMVARRRARLDHLERRQAQLVGLLEGVGPAEVQEPSGHYRIVHGRDAFFRRMEELVHEARDEALVAVTDAAGMRHMAEMDTDTRRQETPARFLLGDGPVPAYCRNAEAVRVHRGLDMRIVLADRTQLLMSMVFGDDARGDVAILTDAEAIVRAQRDWFNHLWELAEAPAVSA